MARPEGFEPPAFRIGICCDIQLRHGRILHDEITCKKNYITGKNKNQVLSQLLLKYFLYRIKAILPCGPKANPLIH